MPSASSHPCVGRKKYYLRHLLVKLKTTKTKKKIDKIDTVRPGADRK